MEATKETKIAAALLGTGLGMLALALAHLIADLNKAFEAAITLHKGIGPYSGKEALAAIVWLVSWAILRATLKPNLNMRRVLIIFLVLAGVATFILFPPFLWLLAS
ncbi:hypothetical protein SDD30_07050 [Moorella naiadis]|uniref:hypothetical protein n=1 Tax=Moorella naiadis (nom. illeg.) TaxID=3093670 RepID=UPI003D9C7FC5